MRQSRSALSPVRCSATTLSASGCRRVGSSSSSTRTPRLARFETERLTRRRAQRPEASRSLPVPATRRWSRSLIGGPPSAARFRSGRFPPTRTRRISARRWMASCGNSSVRTDTWRMSGLRLSEALAADIDDLERHGAGRRLRILRRSTQVSAPLSPETARAIDSYIGERTMGRSSWASTAPVWTACSPSPREAAGSPRRYHETDLAAQASPHRQNSLTRQALLRPWRAWTC